MMKSSVRRLGLAALLVLLPSLVTAQTVTRLPTQINNAAVTDLGNGPIEIKVLSGNVQLFTSSSSGAAGCILANCTLGTSTTALPLSATPTTVPLVGGVVSGTAITSGTTVASFAAGTNIITLSAAMTVATATTVSYGAACPASVGSNPVMLVQAGVGGDLPLYTQARICGSAQNAPGATLLSFAIGAH